MHDPSRGQAEDVRVVHLLTKGRLIFRCAMRHDSLNAGLDSLRRKKMASGDVMSVHEFVVPIS
jgi:hypothetical protein